MLFICLLLAYDRSTTVSKHGDGTCHPPTTRDSTRQRDLLAADSSLLLQAYRGVIVAAVAAAKTSAARRMAQVAIILRKWRAAAADARRVRVELLVAAEEARSAHTAKSMHIACRLAQQTCCWLKMRSEMAVSSGLRLRELMSDSTAGHLAHIWVGIRDLGLAAVWMFACPCGVHCLTSSDMSSCGCQGASAAARQFCSLA